MAFAEDWIEPALRKRLELYKRRYPLFKIERVIQDVETWPIKSQRWAPYMQDKDIKQLNKTYQRLKSWASLAQNDNW